MSIDLFDLYSPKRCVLFFPILRDKELETQRGKWLTVSTMLVLEPGPSAKPWLYIRYSFCSIQLFLPVLPAVGNVTSNTHETSEEESSVQLWLRIKKESFHLIFFPVFNSCCPAPPARPMDVAIFPLRTGRGIFSHILVVCTLGLAPPGPGTPRRTRGGWHTWGLAHPRYGPWLHLGHEPRTFCM